MDTKAAALADVVAAGLAAWVAEGAAVGLAADVAPLLGAAPPHAASPPISTIDIAVLARPGPLARTPVTGPDSRHWPTGPPPLNRHSRRPSPLFPVGGSRGSCQ